MAKVGRPTKYRKEMCKKLVDFMAKGFSKEATAAHLDISKETLYDWGKNIPEFSDAIRKGELKSLLFWENIGMDGMTGQIPGFGPSIWVFNMKNRHKWRDQPEEDVTNKQTPVLIINQAK